MQLCKISIADKGRKPCREWHREQDGKSNNIWNV